MSQKWNVAGTYFEACNCNVACPYVFLSPPTEGECLFPLYLGVCRFWA